MLTVKAESNITDDRNISSDVIAKFLDYAKTHINGAISANAANDRIALNRYVEDLVQTSLAIQGNLG